MPFWKKVYAICNTSLRNYHYRKLNKYVFINHFCVCFWILQFLNVFLMLILNNFIFCQGHFGSVIIYQELLSLTSLFMQYSIVTIMAVLGNQIQQTFLQTLNKLHLDDATNILFMTGGNSLVWVSASCWSRVTVACSCCIRDVNWRTIHVSTAAYLYIGTWGTS